MELGFWKVRACVLLRFQNRICPVPSRVIGDPDFDQHILGGFCPVSSSYPRTPLLGMRPRLMGTGPSALVSALTADGSQV